MAFLRQLNSCVCGVLPRALACLLGALLAPSFSRADVIEFTEAERGHLDLALRALNASEADLGFAKDVGEPRSALKWIRDALEHPLVLNRVGQELWDCAAKDSPAGWWTFAGERLEGGTRKEAPFDGDAQTVAWTNAPPPLRVALDAFYVAAQQADELLLRAFSELSPDEMQYLAGATFSGGLNLEDEAASRAALLDIGIGQTTVEELLAEAKALDAKPAAEKFLAAAMRVHRADILEAGRIFQAAVYAFAVQVGELASWPERSLSWHTPLGVVFIKTDDAPLPAGDSLLIVSATGNDLYQRECGSANGLIRNRLSAIIDLSGDDVFVGNTLLGPGAALFGVSVVLDLTGADTWRSAYSGMGAGLWGVGWVEDRAGDDIYEGRVFGQGAGLGGVGVLMDRGGNDSYRIGWQGQGFAGWMGFGLLLDRAGADRYVAGGRELDHDRNPDRYLSLAQGFSIGARPFAGGGVGALLDLSGNDVYDADVFAQGVSYYYSAGFLLDGGGHDRYSVHHYGQGCGIHLSLGLLVDVAGDDLYKGGTLAQGAAHDFAVGGLLDRAGDDTYVATRNAQGHGMNNALGWLLDAGGDDVYDGRDTESTQGIGNTGGTRESGSIGLLLDLGGTDRYSSAGANDRLLLRPHYGVLYDVGSTASEETAP